MWLPIPSVPPQSAVTPWNCNFLDPSLACELPSLEWAHRYWQMSCTADMILYKKCEGLWIDPNGYNNQWYKQGNITSLSRKLVKSMARQPSKRLIERNTRNFQLFFKEIHCFEIMQLCSKKYPKLTLREISYFINKSNGEGPLYGFLTDQTLLFILLVYHYFNLSI